MEERIQKLISAAGICSRRDAEEMIKSGRVVVNDRIAEIGDKADPQKDKIYVDGQLLEMEEKVYLALYKPRNVETTLSSNINHKTIAQYLPTHPRVYPVGRLDADAEGIILCTNDGEFANRIMHPRYEVEKTYRAYLVEPITEKQIKEINDGLMLKDGPAVGAKARIVGKGGIEVEIIIHEGRNKIVKRMFKAVNSYVRRLQRIKVGPIHLGDLKPGQYRPLTTQEVEKLRELTRNPKPKPNLRSFYWRMRKEGKIESRFDRKNPFDRPTEGERRRFKQQFKSGQNASRLSTREDKEKRQLQPREPWESRSASGARNNTSFQKEKKNPFDGSQRTLRPWRNEQNRTSQNKYPHDRGQNSSFEKPDKGKKRQKRRFH